MKAFQGAKTRRFDLLKACNQVRLTLYEMYFSFSDTRMFKVAFQLAAPWVTASREHLRHSQNTTHKYPFTT